MQEFNDWSQRMLSPKKSKGKRKASPVTISSPKRNKTHQEIVDEGKGKRKASPTIVTPPRANEIPKEVVDLTHSPSPPPALGVPGPSRKPQPKVRNRKGLSDMIVESQIRRQAQKSKEQVEEEARIMEEKTATRERLVAEGKIIPLPPLIMKPLGHTSPPSSSEP